MTKLTTAKQREMLAVTGNDTERRLVADIRRLTKERDRLQSAFDTQQGWLNECQAELEKKS